MGSETKSCESQIVDPTLFLNAMEHRGILHFSIGGKEISYDEILNEMKEKLSL